MYNHGKLFMTISVIVILGYKKYIYNMAQYKVVLFSINVLIFSLFLQSIYYGDSLVGPYDWKPEGCGFDHRRGRHHSFVEIDHDIFSTVILSLLLIQEGKLSVSGERMCTILVRGLSLPSKCVVR